MRATIQLHHRPHLTNQLPACELAARERRVPTPRPLTTAACPHVRQILPPTASVGCRTLDLRRSTYVQ